MFLYVYVWYVRAHGKSLSVFCLAIAIHDQLNPLITGPFLGNAFSESLSITDVECTEPKQIDFELHLQRYEHFWLYVSRFKTTLIHLA